MGQLHNLDEWAQLLPRKPIDVVSALEAWVAEENYDLEHRDWFKNGRSNAPVARVLRREPGDGVELVLKFSDSQDRIANLRRGWAQSEGFREAHMAEIENVLLRLGERWRAVYMRIAGGHLGRVRALTEHRHKQSFPEYCSTIVRSVIIDWNNGNARRESPTVGKLVRDIIGGRQRDVNEWAQSRGVHVDGSAGAIRLAGWPEPLPNPFQLLSGEEAGRLAEDTIVGKAHGDLSCRNIFVVSEPEVNPSEYLLIDYDKFSEKAPLARDPMHLLVALALDDLESLGPGLWPDLARVLVNPEARDIPGHLDHFQRIARGIHTASRELATAKGSGRRWDEQCLLSLAGVGLVHLGRTLYTKDPEAGKEWCLQVAALATEAYLRKRREQGGAAASSPGHGGAAPPPGHGGAAPPPGDLVDRTSELSDLRARLTNGPGGVVVLRGVRGVGKTSLVKAALKEVAHRVRHNGPVRVHEHDVTTASALDARTLIDYVAGDNELAPPVRYARSSLVRLEAALRRLRDEPVVVTVDSAENLIDPATRRFADPDLDEVLEMLATENGHRVTVLIVTREALIGHTHDRTWPISQPQLHLGQLPATHFFTYLTSLDPKGRTNARQLLDDRQREELYQRLHGNPRLADLVYGVVVVAAKFELPKLAEHLLTVERRDVPMRLIGLVLDGLHPRYQRVLQALAAVDIPTPADVVSALLNNFYPDEGISSDDVESALRFLTTEHIVRQTQSDGHYYLPAKDGDLILNRTLDPAGRSRLYVLASAELTCLRIENPSSIADLRYHFAELRALMNSGPDNAGAAYEMLDALDDILREWNCEDLLLQERLRLRGQLRNQRYVMGNENDLGDIYASRGEFGEADRAFGKALEIANTLGDEFRKVQIWPNFASLYWQMGHIGYAQCYYEAAHREAEKLYLPMTRMLALEGLADCHRRRGRYRLAVLHAEQALALVTEVLSPPGLPGLPATKTAVHRATSLGVAVALKLARWHSELIQFEVAEAYLRRAVTLANQRSDDWLQASCLDGAADLAFNRNDFVTAETEAERAVEMALALNDPITLLQARTTLCLIHLKNGRIPAARREIERAYRHRRRHRSLIVLALLGVVARYTEDDGAAERWFGELEFDARRRIERDGDDFSARDFLGYAICGMRLRAKDSLEEAARAIREARATSAPTPLLVDRLRFLLKLLVNRAVEPDRFTPVMEALDSPNRIGE